MAQALALTGTLVIERDTLAGLLAIATGTLGAIHFAWALYGARSDQIEAGTPVKTAAFGRLRIAAYIVLQAAGFTLMLVLTYLGLAWTGFIGDAPR